MILYCTICYLIGIPIMVFQFPVTKRNLLRILFIFLLSPITSMIFMIAAVIKDDGTNCTEEKQL